MAAWGWVSLSLTLKWTKVYTLRCGPLPFCAVAGASSSYSTRGAAFSPVSPLLERPRSRPPLVSPIGLLGQCSLSWGPLPRAAHRLLRILDAGTFVQIPWPELASLPDML